MKRNRFLRTSVVRVAALFAAAFVLGSTLLLAAVYYAASRIIDRDIETLIVEEGNDLAQQYTKIDREAFAALVHLRATEFGARGELYALLGPDGRMLAGNLSEWPAGTGRKAAWVEFTFRPQRSHRSEERRVGKAPTTAICMRSVPGPMSSVMATACSSATTSQRSAPSSP